MDKLAEKRKLFEESRKQIKIRKGTLKLILVIAGIIGIAGTGVFLLGNTPTGEVVLNPVDYRKLKVDMVQVEYKEEGNQISISLDDLEKYKIVYFSYGKTPLLAYVGPSGKVITAIRMCEPCKGYSFSINDNKLHCDACGTEWTMETHIGLSGGCKKYPPEIIENEIKNNKVYMNIEEINSWTPRA